MKTEFVDPIGNILIPVSDFPGSVQPGATVSHYGKNYVVVDQPPRTERRDTTLGPTWVRVVTVEAPKPPAPKPAPEPAKPEVKPAEPRPAEPKPKGKDKSHKGGKSLVAEVKRG